MITLSKCHRSLTTPTNLRPNPHTLTLLPHSLKRYKRWMEAPFSVSSASVTLAFLHEGTFLLEGLGKVLDVAHGLGGSGLRGHLFGGGFGLRRHLRCRLDRKAFEKQNKTPEIATTTTTTETTKR